MRDKLKEYKGFIEEQSYSLWQGNGAEIEEIGNVIQKLASIVVEISENLSEQDKVTTLSYIRKALSDYELACNARDDFLLADCLYYEWREIAIIYIDY
jgi:hypothetical protein